MHPCMQGKWELCCKLSVPKKMPKELPLYYLFHTLIKKIYIYNYYITRQIVYRWILYRIVSIYFYQYTALVENEVLCESKCGATNIPLCSKAIINTEHMDKCWIHSPLLMVVRLHTFERFSERGVKQYISLNNHGDIDCEMTKITISIQSHKSYRKYK
jgi:hypothetical protein